LVDVEEFGKPGAGVVVVVRSSELEVLDVDTLADRLRLGSVVGLSTRVETGVQA